MDAQRANPEDHGKQRPSHQEPADIFSARLEQVVLVAQQHQTEGYPETAIGREGAIAESVAGFLFLQASDQLGGSADDEAQPNHRADAGHPADVVELQDQRG